MRETKVFSKNSTYQKFEVLKTNRNKRYRYNEFLVEGVRSLNEAVKNKWNIKSFIYDRNNLSGWAKEMIANVKTDENFCLTAELMNDLSNKDDVSKQIERTVSEFSYCRNYRTQAKSDLFS